MQNVSLEFKENIEKNAIISDGYLIFTDNDLYTETFDSSDIMSFAISGNAFENDKVIGNIAQTSLTIELLGDKTVLIPQNKEIYIKVFIGIYINDVIGYEYVELNDFLLFDIIHDDVSNVTKIHATDELIKLNQDFVDTNTYPIGLLAYANSVVSSCGLQLENTTFLNDTFVLESKPFIDNTSAREIVSKIAELACSFVVINRDTGKLELRSAFPKARGLTYFDMSVFTYAELKNNTYLYYGTITNNKLEQSNYFKLQFKENNFGLNGINTVVMKISQVEGENNTVENAANVAIDGAIELVIEDNDIVNSEAKRLQVINNIFNETDGYKHEAYNLEYIGYPYFELGDVIGLYKKNNELIEAPIFEFSMQYNGGLFGKINAKSLSKTQTSNKFVTPIEKRLRNAEIKVDKANAEIDLRVEKTDYNAETVVSFINLAPDTIKISSKNLELDGLVEITNFTYDNLGGTKPPSNADRTKTVIDGGLITTGAVEVGSGSTVKAGMRGSGTSDTEIRFWAGQTQANRDSAPFRVNQAGQLWATDAHIEGDLTAGTIAGLNFNNSAITFPDGKLKLNSATNSIEFGSFKLKHSSYTPQVGTPSDILSAYSSVYTTESPIQLGFSSDIGAFINVENIIFTGGELKLGYISATVRLPMGVKWWDDRMLSVDANGFVKAT